ncbi:MAG TPA: GYF domain-containing protein [Polyangiaceae bacterium]
MKFLCEQCKAKYQIADDKAAGKTVRMKCRKCGYLIEVRAAATEGSASASQPPGPGGSKPPPGPRAAQKPAPPRAGPLATSLASARSPAKPGGPLANALKTALQREDEVSAPVDMSDLSPSDEWYVAINGVPVGPIRIGEVRRKAAIGAVTDESLCWQEGLDEWRPLRSFPELAALVREAFSSGRSSLTPQPPPDGRASLPPPGRTSVRPAGPAGVAPRAPAPRSPVASAPPPAARSNVVPFASRLATAEKLAEPPDDLTRPFTGQPITARAVEPSVQPDPFAAPPRPNPAPMAPGFSYAATGAAMAPMTPSPSRPPGSLSFGDVPKKGLPWMAIAMVAAAAAFGITAGIAVFLRPPQQPTPVVVQVPGAAATVAAAGTAGAPTSTSTTETPEPTAPTTTAARPVALAAIPKGTPSAAGPAAAGHGPLDLHGLTGGTTISPVDDPGGGSEGPKAPGQCISEGQVQQVIGLHSVGLRRACWERSTASKTTANVTVSLTIGADGSAQGVSASGDEASVASCIASDVRNWRFPAMGCSQRTAIPFHFVRQ